MFLLIVLVVFLCSVQSDPHSPQVFSIKRFTNGTDTIVYNDCTKRTCNYDETALYQQSILCVKNKLLVNTEECQYSLVKDGNTSHIPTIKLPELKQYSVIKRKPSKTESGECSLSFCVQYHNNRWKNWECVPQNMKECFHMNTRQGNKASISFKCIDDKDIVKFLDGQILLVRLDCSKSSAPSCLLFKIPGVIKVDMEKDKCGITPSSPMAASISEMFTESYRIASPNWSSTDTIFTAAAIINSTAENIKTTLLSTPISLSRSPTYQYTVAASSVFASTSEIFTESTEIFDKILTEASTIQARTTNTLTADLSSTTITQSTKPSTHQYTVMKSATEPVIARKITTTPKMTEILSKLSITPRKISKTTTLSTKTTRKRPKMSTTPVIMWTTSSTIAQHGNVTKFRSKTTLSSLESVTATTIALNNTKLPTIRITRRIRRRGKERFAKEDSPLLVYGVPAASTGLFFLCLILFYMLCCYGRKKRRYEAKQKEDTKQLVPLVDVKANTKNQEITGIRKETNAELLYHSENDQQLARPLSGNFSNNGRINWPASFIKNNDGGHSRTTSRSSGSVFYAEEPVETTDSDSMATGSLTRLKIKKSSHQTIKRENSFKRSNSVNKKYS